MRCSGPAWVVATAVGDRFEQTAVWILEEEPDREPVVAFSPGHTGLVKTPLDELALGLGDADCGVIARTPTLVKGKARVPDIGQHGVSLSLDDPSPEHPLVEGREPAGVVGFESRMVEA